MKKLQAKLNEHVNLLNLSDPLTLKYSQDLDPYIVEAQLKIMRGERNEG